MTAPEPAYAPVPPVAPTGVEPARYRYGDARYGMSLVAVLLGTYSLVASPVGQVAQVLLSRQLELVPLIVGPIVFAGVVLVVGVLLAPTTPGRRLVALALVLVAILVVDLVIPGYYAGTVRLPAVASFLLGPAFLYTLASSAAWLTLRERNPISYVFLVATIVIPLALFGVVSTGAGSGVSTAVQNVLVTVIGVGIAWAGWAVSRRTPPAHPTA